MKINYDLHIHSALSPCADDDMTPVNIVGFAHLSGLDMIAVADHNAIGNVEVAIKAGEKYGVTVVPAIELQTEEDIHILCLFKTYHALKNFFESITFVELQNRPEIFGNQLLFDEDNIVVGREMRLLVAGAKISVGEIKARVEAFGGAAVPAHIDREANGILSILGAIPEEFSALELSNSVSAAYRKAYGNYRLIIDSDAHTLNGIKGNIIELPECTPKALIDYLNVNNRKIK
jgi:histidinol phosphatase-like PHP family hydrolase